MTLARPHPARGAPGPDPGAAVSAQLLTRYADADLLGDADPAAAVAVFELQVEGEPASRSVVYFKPAKDLAWPQPGVQARVEREGAGLVLHLQTATLARGVWVEFEGLGVGEDVELADNALTLLPGETLSLKLSSSASLENLRRSLRLRVVASAQ